jgi:hypothetical protein
LADQLTVRDAIERDLGQDLPGDGVVKVAETSLLEADLREYVLTSQLAEEYRKVLARVVESAQPAGPATSKVGVWVSGFFGSGKSHFAKVVGHLLADTPAGKSTARELFRHHLQSGRQADDEVAALLQQAATYRLRVHLVPFDISTLHTAGGGVGVTFLRAFYQSLGLSSVMPFAEQELELREAGRWDEFLTAYQQRAGADWHEDRELFSALSTFAELLAEHLPMRYPSAAAAENSLNFAQTELDKLTIDGAVDRMLRWVDRRQAESKDAHRVLFVADEVGAWSGRQLERIEQIRSLVELFASKGGGRLWLIATSQERLSDVIANSPDVATDQQAQEMLQRLEARFPVNIHLESGEVGTVIEHRILKKRPVARPALERVWDQNRGQLADIGESPGIELNANYPRMERDYFIRDYPFLPYQLPAAAEIFGNMRSVKVSQGARSMLRVALDALRSVADEPVGTIIGWDQVFDSANRGNEFQGEEYLGSLGVEHINRADRDLAGLVSGVIDRPSRLLRVLWLVQQNNRIPRTVGNLARLLATDVKEDVLELERKVEETLKQLESLSYVRREPASEEWRFLTPDEVTIEKILTRIATQDVKEIDVRRERQDLVADQLKSIATGRITMGKTQTPFEYGVYLNEVSVTNSGAPVSLRVAFGGSEPAKRIAEEYAGYLTEPQVDWIIELPKRLDDRIRRRIAIERLPSDDEFQQKATQRTRDEAKRLDGEAVQIASDVAADVASVLRTGTLYVAGKRQELAASAKGGSVRPMIEEAIRDRLQHVYHQFGDGDQPYNPNNTEKLLTVAPADRSSLSPDLHIFDAEGHVVPTHPVVDAFLRHLNTATKNAGADVAGWFTLEPRGWPRDLARYVAAALFVDGRLVISDASGKTFDNPKDATARAQFGTGAFRTLRLIVEENPLRPDEIKAARDLLSSLGYPTKDANELTVADAALELVGDLRSDATVIDRARENGFPLASEFDAGPLLIEELSGADTRVKRLRTLLDRHEDVKQAKALLDQLKDFADHHGFQQYRRTEQLREVSREAALHDDSVWGEQAADADAQLQALVEQARVLPEWHDAYADHRQRLLDAFKGVYVPLFESTRGAVDEARESLTKSPEHTTLDSDRSMRFFREWLVTGRPLAELRDVPLTSDDDLLRAQATYSINHLRTLASSLPATVAGARQAIIEALADQQREQEGASKLAVWRPADVFGGRTFADADEVSDAFDDAKKEVLALIEQGKTVKVV